MQKDTFNKNALHPLQTWEWGEFRQKWGNDIVFSKIGILTFHKIPLLPFTVSTFIRGKIPDKNEVVELKKIATNKKSIFIKLEPNVLNNKKDVAFLQNNCFKKGKTLFTPTSFWIDLTKSEEELLKSFHPKTRYNIRVAQKHGVEVVEDNSELAFEKFLLLYKETTQRQGFYAHNEKYFRLMWQELNPAGIARLLTAKYKDEILTAWVVFVWRDFLYYPYGASTDKYKNVMSSSLMMWEAIRFGKKLGLKTFDLWGREEGKGFTKFKEGFNPKVVEFLGTWDLPTSPLYNLFTLADKLRWIILRIKAKVINPQF